MNNPFFWLGISILLVAISLMALLTVAIFVLQELARAARSAEKLLDTLNRELPATLQDIRLTGRDLSGLSDEVTGSVKSARNVVEQVDKGLVEAKVQAQRAQITTRSLMAGATAALKVLVLGKPRRRRRPPTPPLATRQHATRQPSVRQHANSDSPGDSPTREPSTQPKPLNQQNSNQQNSNQQNSNQQSSNQQNSAVDAAPGEVSPHAELSQTKHFP